VVEAMLPGGTLHPWRRGALPVIAAAGGTLGAIAVYHAVVSGADEPVLALGWPIASAVDIAVGFPVARSIFGRHAAVTFLLLLTIASDTIGLVLVSRRYPVGDVYPGAVALMVFGIAAAIGLRRSRVRRVWPYVLICGTLSWFRCFWSGVHPALALLPIGGPTAPRGPLRNLRCQPRIDPAFLQPLASAGSRHRRRSSCSSIASCDQTRKNSHGSAR
jgi:NhaA family Na+:H+ antiporter